jgi:hypothetical protein
VAGPQRVPAMNDARNVRRPPSPGRDHKSSLLPADSALATGLGCMTGTSAHIARIRIHVRIMPPSATS